MTKTELDQLKEIYAETIAQPNFKFADLFKCLKENADIAPLRCWALGMGAKEKDFDKAANRWKVETALGGFPETSRDYVRLFADRQNWNLRYNGLIDTADDTVDTSEAGRLLKLEAERLDLRIAERTIDIAFDQWREECRRSIAANAFARISAQGVAVDWEALATAITDTAVTPLELSVAALQATIWQVKRKLAGLPVHDHAMIVFQGKQGGGKSQFVTKLASPIADMMSRADFSQITDNAYHELWSSPLIFIDEMAGADKRDAAAIKEAITKETHHGRVHRTHSSTTIQCRHTMIGAMNGRLSDLIKDPTGMRRFVPIQFLPSPHRVAAGEPCADWDTINSVDWLAMWQSVDHTAEHPLTAVRSLWHDASESERMMDSVEGWLRAARPTVDNRNIRLNGEGVWQAYSEWCERNGYKNILASNPLAKQMRLYEAEAWFPFSPAERDKHGRYRMWADQFPNLRAA